LAGKQDLEVSPFTIGEYYRVARLEVSDRISECLLRLDFDLGGLRNATREQSQGKSQAQPKSDH
jgi:hypothetical protein